jgi:predicted DsbA family dithiol-disulfide isomerase
VNALAPIAARQTVEIVHDFVCPWCYLGIRRLLRALGTRPDRSMSLVWRPFLLNPDMAPEGMGRGDYALRKYGGEGRARRLYAAVTRLGLPDGVVFQFDRMTRIPCSVDAHRLVGWAARSADATRLVESLFAAHFSDGADISCHETLVEIAAGAGFDADDAMAALASGDGEDQVHGENRRAHRSGISGVPCVVFGGGFAVSGAQEMEVFQRLFDASTLDLVSG